MAWRPPETFGSLPPAAWPVEAFVLVAMSAQEIGQVVLVVLGGSAVPIGLVGKWAWTKWEGSNLKKLIEAQAELKESRKETAREKVERDECDAERDAEREHHNKTMGRKDDEIDRLQGIVNALRVELAAAHKTISERDSQINNRDMDIQINRRDIHILQKDVGKITHHLLVLLGDAKSRAIP